MTPKEKAKDLVEKMALKSATFKINKHSKKCAKIAIKNEYFSLRELVMRLKPSLSETLYLQLIDNLINEEKEIIFEIENL